MDYLTSTICILQLPLFMLSDLPETYLKIFFAVFDKVSTLFKGLLQTGPVLLQYHWLNYPISVNSEISNSLYVWKSYQKYTSSCSRILPLYHKKVKEIVSEVALWFSMSGLGMQILMYTHHLWIINTNQNFIKKQSENPWVKF